MVKPAMSAPGGTKPECGAVKPGGPVLRGGRGVSVWLLVGNDWGVLTWWGRSTCFASLWGTGGRR